jgi:20S proteasome alpha/beta subunit
MCCCVKEKTNYFFLKKKNQQQFVLFHQFQIDSHIGIGVSGLTADARSLCKYMRDEVNKTSERYCCVCVSCSLLKFVAQ